LITVPLEQLFHKDLSMIEQFFETSIFKWGINIFIIFLLIVLIKGQQWINRLLENYNWLRIIIKVIFIGGVIGWVIGLSSLIF